jgi:hypothetical protein
MRTDERGALGYKPTIRDLIIAIVVVLLLVPLITSSCYYKVLSPFSLPDTSFTLFFLLLAISCSVSYVLLEFEKSLSLHPLVKAAFPIKASIFQLAYFLFGKNRAIQTAIVDLVRRKLLVVTKDKLFLVYKERYEQSENEQNPLIPALLKEERTCITYDRIVYIWYHKNLLDHPVLQPIQLLADHRKRFGLLLLPFVIGIARLIQCMVNNLPGDTIFWELSLLGVISWLLLKHVSGGSLMRFKAKQLVNRQRETEVLYPYSVVSNFALEGNDAIERYSDGLVLIELFKLGPFIDKVSDGVVTFLEHSAEEKGNLQWTGKSNSHWNYTRDAETLMKEIENQCLR